MNCINLKNRTKKGQRYIYCTHKKQTITFNDCRNCPYKEYKQYKTIKKRAYKQAKAEKERYSIIYQDLSKCCVDGCLTPYYGVQKNEVFDGSYRQLSMKYGMVCPLCKNHHDQFHNDRKFAIKYKILFEKEFLKTHSLDEWLDIFKMDYRYK